MKFNWDIVGHESQIESLEREIFDNKVSHAYLFSGVRQSGKVRTARIFGNILQCDNGYCGTCKDCQLIKSGSHPDFIVMKDRGESIKIDEVRELARKTNLTSNSKYRVVIIENIERMPVEAQNSFLKTLEEPAGNTVFILTTSQLDRVLLTIQSRVRHYNYSTTEDSVLKSYLKETFGANPELDEIVNMAQGRPGLAITLLKDHETFTHQKNIYYQIENFLKKNDLSQKFTFIEGIEKDPEEIELFIDAFTRILRKLIHEYMHLPSHPLKKRFALDDIVKLFEFLEKTRYFIRGNVNKKLVLENLLIQTEK